MPLLSPREMKGALAAAIFASAATMSLPLTPAGSPLRSDEHEVVVHDRQALDARSLRRRTSPRPPVVHEQHVGVAAPRHVERLAGADRDHLDVDAGGLLERRQQVREQARLLGRRGRRHRDGLCCRAATQTQRSPAPTRRARREHERFRHRLHASLSFDKQDGLRSGSGTAEEIVRPAGRPARGRAPGRRRGVARRLAWPRLWVLITSVMPSARTSAISASTSRLARGSRLAVGSSSSSMSGCSAQARASARRCCWPPDSVRALRRREPRPGRRAAAPRSAPRAAPRATACRAARAPSATLLQHAGAQHERPLEHHRLRAAAASRTRPRRRVRRPGRAAGAAAWSCRCRWRRPGRRARRRAIAQVDAGAAPARAPKRTSTACS